MPSLLDREIDTESADAFGHRHFASALKSLIESPMNHPPFSVGLLGHWGTGKSSIKSLYLKGLNEDTQRGKDGKGATRRERFYPITFNAWRYGENVRRALLRYVFCELGGDEDAITDRLFNQVQKPTLLPRDSQTLLRDFYDKWVWPVPQLLIAILLAIGLTYLAARVFRLEEQWVLAVVFGINALLVGMLTKFLLDPKRFYVPRYTTVTRVELPTVSAEQYEQFLADQITEFKTKNPKCERIVIFVDDLDRLSSEEMVTGLDAVRALMEMSSERLKGVGVVFVISCDEERIADALANRRKQSSDLPGAVHTHYDARRYLDRIFQFRLEIPPFPRQDMRSYALKRLKSELPQIASGIEKRGASVEEVVSRMIHVGVQSPRNALQILNGFVQSWWVATERERDGAGTDRPGGLGEGAVTRYPVALAVLAALRADFPDFYNDLLKEPELITRFTDVFIRGLPLSQQPEGARVLLACYAETAVDDSVETKEARLLRKYRPLRQFLAGIIGITWPPSIAPLLLLSQDPVTRKMGDAARRVYNSFVNGDAKGVLEDLGKDKDDRPLATEHMQLLRDLSEDVERETDDRRDNVAAVLAALAGRYPQSDAHHLLVPLARRLADSPRLRWRLGIDGISSVLPGVTKEDRQAVASRLVSDLFKNSEEIDFRLPSGGVPSLDEAVALVRDGAETVLRVYASDGLDARTEALLLDWLMARHIGSGGRVQRLPFADMESWVASHETVLVEALGSRYADTLAAGIEARDPGVPDREAIVRRTRTIFEGMYAGGQDRRGDMWRLVARYGGTTNIGAGEIATETVEKYGGEPGAECSEAIVSIAERLTTGYKDTDNPLTHEDRSAVDALRRTIEVRNDLSAEALNALSVLAGVLGSQPATTNDAIPLAEALLSRGAPGTDEMLVEWAAHATTDLTDPGIDFLARHFGDALGDSGRNLVISQFNDLAQETDPDEGSVQRYRRMVEGLTDESLRMEPMATHIARLMTWVERQHANPAYLRRIFRVIPHVLRIAPPQAAGNMLNVLFSNTRTAPSEAGFLYGEMVGAWPRPTAEWEPYEPHSICQWAATTVSNSPSIAEVPLILDSMADMVRRGLTGQEGKQALLGTLLTAWQYHPRNALSLLKEHLAVDPTPAQIADLSSGMPPEEGEPLACLREAWQFYSARLDQGERLAVAKRLLALSSPSSSIGPDPWLRLWFDVTPADLVHATSVVLEDDGFNDDQKERIWRQYERHAGELGQQSALHLLSAFLVHPSAPKTVRAALDFQQEISRLFANADEKFDLGVVLLKALFQAPTLEVKNRLADWLKSLGNSGVLKEVGNIGGYTDQDLDLLAPAFPNSRELKKLRRQD
jgi:hypothetical protein